MKPGTWRFRTRCRLFPAILLSGLFACPASAQSASAAAPAWLRLLTLQDHNTRIVLVGALILGCACGVMGTFLLLRKRALVSDAVSHATLPGIALAFLVMAAAGGSGKHLGGLLLGGLLTGLLGMGMVTLIRTQTRLKEDAALGIVLSVFFGLGVALLGVIQKMPAGHAAGLESFIYGKTASMLTGDALLIAVSALAVLLLCLAFFKEFTLLCFDEAFAAAQGWPVRRLDALMLALVVAVTVIGLQAVGLILMVALLVIPPAAARFWTRRTSTMLPVSAFIGSVICLVGAGISALQPRMPAGAVIVLTGTVAFSFSFIFGSERGVWMKSLHQRRLRRKVGLQHLLRAMYEWLEQVYPNALEQAVEGSPGMPWQDLLEVRSWHATTLRRWVHGAHRRGWVLALPEGTLQLTRAGLVQARRVVRNHRLWEIYLVTHADIAPSHVDRDADQVEHVLGTELVRHLERLTHHVEGISWVPPNPHLPAMPASVRRRQGGPLS